MITVEQAYKIVMGAASCTGDETVPFSESAGRVLSEDIKSDTDMPPFNRSAVDGYACRRADLESDLEIVELIKAGKIPSVKPVNGQCSKIMTGAIIPEGCDFVFMVEDSRILNSGKVIYTGKSLKSNMSRKGDDLKKGDTVLKKGRLIKPQDIALLAAVGKVNVKVASKPRIGIISTGDELVEPDVIPGLSEIRNSNSYQLKAQAERSGCLVEYYGIAPDVEEKTLNLIEKAISGNELVLLTGGVSMGDFDFVPSVLKRAGVKVLFERVNVQPGKPTIFGTYDKGVVFGLPGNPVSAFVQFETLVRPLIYKMMGHNWRPDEKVLPMGMEYERKQSERVAWLPVKITEKYEVIPVEYHGSAHIAAFPEADGIIRIDSGKNILHKGELVVVRQI